jgi:hypothetical protein
MNASPALWERSPSSRSGTAAVTAVRRRRRRCLTRALCLWRCARVLQDKCPTLIENEPPVKKCRSSEDCADHQECVFTVGDCGPRITTTDPLAKADADSSDAAAAAPDTAEAGAESALTRPPWSVVTGVCKARIFCIRSEPFCSCSGQSYCACRPDRPTRSHGACKGQHPPCKWIKSAEEDRTAADAVAAADEAAAASAAAADPAPDAASDSSAATDAPASMLTRAPSLHSLAHSCADSAVRCALLCPCCAVAEQRRNGLGRVRSRRVVCRVVLCSPLSAFASSPRLFTAPLHRYRRALRALRSFCSAPPFVVSQFAVPLNKSSRIAFFHTAAVAAVLNVTHPLTRTRLFGTSPPPPPPSFAPSSQVRRYRPTMEAAQRALF